MSFSTDVRDACSLAAVQVLSQLGETVLYSNRGAAQITLFAAVDDVTKTLGNNLKIDVENSDAVFTIPRTLDTDGVTVLFPPTNGVTIGDEITFGSIIYNISDFTCDSSQAIFDMRCNRRQARRIA